MTQERARKKLFRHLFPIATLPGIFRQITSRKRLQTFRPNYRLSIVIGLIPPEMFSLTCRDLHGCHSSPALGFVGVAVLHMVMTAASHCFWLTCCALHDHTNIALFPWVRRSRLRALLAAWVVNLKRPAPPLPPNLYQHMYMKIFVDSLCSTWYMVITAVSRRFALTGCARHGFNSSLAVAFVDSLCAPWCGTLVLCCLLFGFVVRGSRRVKLLGSRTFNEQPPLPPKISTHAYACFR